MLLLPEEHPGNFYWSLVDSCPDATLELHLQNLGVVALHGRVQLGNLHLDVLYRHLYGHQHYLLLLCNLGICILYILSSSLNVQLSLLPVSWF